MLSEDREGQKSHILTHTWRLKTGIEEGARALETGKGQEGKGKAGLTPHGSEAGGTHSAVLCYNIIANLGAGRELSVVQEDA